MANNYIAGGNIPNENDGRWIVWFKILSVIQGFAGADPADDPNPNDSLWILKFKVNRARNRMV